MKVDFYLDFDEVGKNNLIKITQQLQQYISDGDYLAITRLNIAQLNVDSSYAPFLKQIFEEIKNADTKISIQSIATINTEKLIFAKFKLNIELIKMQKHLHAELVKQFGEFSQKKFYPHLTLVKNITLKMPFLEVKKNIDIYNLPFDATLKLKMK